MGPRSSSTLFRHNHRQSLFIPPAHHPARYRVFSPPSPAPRPHGPLVLATNSSSRGVPPCHRSPTRDAKRRTRRVQDRAACCSSRSFEEDDEGAQSCIIIEERFPAQQREEEPEGGEGAICRATTAVTGLHRIVRGGGGGGGSAAASDGRTRRRMGKGEGEGRRQESHRWRRRSSSQTVSSPRWPHSPPLAPLRTTSGRGGHRLLEAAAAAGRAATTTTTCRRRRPIGHDDGDGDR